MEFVRARAWTVLLASGTVLCLAYVLTDSALVRSATMAAVALSSLSATVLGLRLHRPAVPRPWRLTLLAQVLFLVGVLVRPWSVQQDLPFAAAADAVTLSGYLVCGASILAMTAGTGRLERLALADGAIVCCGAWSVAMLLFALPAYGVESRPGWISLLAGLYPVVDVVLLLLLLNLAFTTAVRLPSYRAFVACLTCIVIGDVGYAWIGAHGELTGPPLIDVPFVAAYGLFGLAALHPSMTGLASPVSRPVQAWSPARLALIVPALATPAALLVLHADMTTPQRWTLGVAALALTVLLLGRAVTAVSAHVEAQRVLLHQSRHDPLTGLPNRVRLDEVLGERIAAARNGGPVTWLIAVDLDGFRFVNDTWGHATGDQLLLHVADRMRELVPTDAFVARTGGDEFAVVVQADTNDALDLADVLRQGLWVPVEVDGMEFVLTGSLGLASTEGEADAVDLLRDADTAMSRAKAEGRDRYVVFGREMRERVRDRLEIELALRYAVERGQLRVAYQPLLDLLTEEVTGCEALVRWDHPTRGAVSPVVFIPVAEETGLVVEVGSWVLGQAVRRAAAWVRDGVVPPSFVMSVNVAPRQLSEPGFCERVQDCLRDSGLPAANLCLEITESAVLAHRENTLAALGRLRALGVGLAVDDFGTGYSSLAYLSELPVTSVKLDRSFVSQMDAGGRDVSIVRAVRALAGALDLGMVAEGVETAQQRDALRALGIPSGQGWLWGPAVPPEEFMARWGLPPADDPDADRHAHQGAHQDGDRDAGGAGTALPRQAWSGQAGSGQAWGGSAPQALTAGGNS